jgi:hypothetical protein
MGSYLQMNEQQNSRMSTAYVEEDPPEVVTSTGVLHLDSQRLVEVVLHDLKHIFPQFAYLGITGQVEIEEPMAFTSAKQVLALRSTTVSEKVEVDGRQGSGNNS